jgi:hypothetical protein
MWRGPRRRTDGLRCSLAGLDPAILDEAVQGRPAAAAEAARHRHQHARVRVRLGRATGQVADAALSGQVTLVTRACWMSATCSSAQVTAAMPWRVSFPTAGSNTTGNRFEPRPPPRRERRTVRRKRLAVLVRRYSRRSSSVGRAARSTSRKRVRGNPPGRGEYGSG